MMSAHCPAHSPHNAEKSPAHYNRTFENGAPLKALAGAVLEKSCLMCECARTKGRTTAHYTQNPHNAPHILRTLQPYTPRQMNPSDPGRMWAAGNPFTCGCGFSTGWLRDGKPLCPACDGKRPVTAKPRKENISPVALSWLRENRKLLQALGWKASELYRRNKSKGIAWVGVWDKPGLSVVIETSGSLSFYFLTATGQKIRQTAWPKKIPSKRNRS